MYGRYTIYGSNPTRSDLYTFIRSRCAKFHQDTFKTERLLCVATDGQIWINSSVDTDSEYINFMGSEFFAKVHCRRLPQINIPSAMVKICNSSILNQDQQPLLFHRFITLLLSLDNSSSFFAFTSFLYPRHLYFFMKSKYYFNK